MLSMKKNLLTIASFLLCAGLMTQGFECGSAEFEGAKVYQQQKNYKEAIRLYEVELQKNPKNEEAWFRLGVVKGEVDDMEGMSDAFHRALKLDSAHAQEIHDIRYNHWATHLNAGVAFKNRASQDSTVYYEKAIAEYKKAVTAWPDTSLTYYYLGPMYVDLKEIDSAIACYQQSWDLTSDRGSYKNVGRLYVNQGMALKAEFDSANADKLKLQKDFLSIKKGSHKSELLGAFGEPAKKTRDRRDRKKEDWIYSQYGLDYTLEGEFVVAKTVLKPYDFKIDSTKYYAALAKFNKAIGIFESLKASDPKDTENLNLLLNAYVQANRIKEAIQAFKLAIENEPGSKLNHYILGILYRTIHDYDAAIAEFKEATMIDPEYADAIYDLGATYYNWGVEMKKTAQEKGNESTAYKEKFKEALPYFEKSSELKPDDPKIWDTLGTIYALLGQSESAMKALNHADELRKSGQ
jgi:tetratricopeptide (TPR) repeat protein